MDLHTELARFNPDPALANWVSCTVQNLLDQSQKDAAEALKQITRRDTELHAAQTLAKGIAGETLVAKPLGGALTKKNATHDVSLERNGVKIDAKSAPLQAVKESPNSTIHFVERKIEYRLHKAVV